MNLSLTHIAALLLATLLISACGTTPKGPPSEVANLQMQLDRMRADSRIGPNADVELREAQRVVDALAADARRLRKDDYDYRLYMADRLVYIAEAEGLARHATRRAEALSRDREGLLVQAREAEAERARREARAAQADARSAQADAEFSRQRAERERQLAAIGQADAERARDEARSAQAIAEAERLRAEAERQAAMRAREEAELAQRQLQSMQAQLADLEARQTERGLVVTLGDVLFEVDKSDLKPGAARNLDKLVAALSDHPQTSVVIEGHTDSTGSREYNLSLSERRANSVRAYLIGGGIDPARLSARGLGLDYPVASNDTAAGRQQNRRVEIIIQQAEG
jgi:outer membrane protein OmpA-like peptidoglycan-associated protein